MKPALAYAAGGGQDYNFRLLVTAPQTDYDVGAELTSLGWDGTTDIRVRLEIQAGVQMDASAVTIPSVDGTAGGVFTATFTIDQAPAASGGCTLSPSASGHGDVVLLLLFGSLAGGFLARRHRRWALGWQMRLAPTQD